MPGSPELRIPISIFMLCMSCMFIPISCSYFIVSTCVCGLRYPQHYVRENHGRFSFSRSPRLKRLRGARSRARPSGDGFAPRLHARCPFKCEASRWAIRLSASKRDGRYHRGRRSRPRAPWSAPDVELMSGKVCNLPGLSYLKDRIRGGARAPPRTLTSYT